MLTLGLWLAVVISFCIGADFQCQQGFVRVRNKKLLFGVCTGLEQWTGINRWLWRLAFVFVGHLIAGGIVYAVFVLDSPENP